MRSLEQEQQVEPALPGRGPGGPRRRVLTLLAAVLVAAVGFGAGLYVDRDGSSTPAPGLASPGVVALIDNMMADLNSGDLDAFAAHFAPNAVWEESGHSVQGRARIEKAMQWLSDQGAEYHRAGVVIQQGDMVAVPMSASMHAPGLLDVMKFDADWKIVHYWSNAG